MKLSKDNIISIFLCAMPILALEIPNITPIFPVIAGLICIDFKAFRRFPKVLMPWVAFLAFTLITVLLSYDYIVSMKEWGKIFFIALGSYLLGSYIVYHAKLGWFMKWYEFAWMAALIIFALDFVVNNWFVNFMPNHDINFFNKGSCTIVMSLWTWLAAINYSKNSSKIYYAFYALIALLVFSLESETAIVALIASFAVYFFTNNNPYGYKFLSTALVIGILLCPVLIYIYMKFFIYKFDYNIPPSWDHRIYIAFDSLYIFLEKPFIGWGIGASKALGNMDQGGILKESHELYKIFNYHPHNLSLQLLVENGILGLLVYSVSWFITIWGVGNAENIDSKLKPCFYATYTSYVIIGMFNFNLWASWFIAAILLQTTILIAINQSNKNRSLLKNKVDF